MNFDFTGTARVLWLIGIALVLVSAVIALTTGGNGGAPLVLLGAAFVGAAFLIHRRNIRG